MHLEINTMYDAIIYEATYGCMLTIKWPHAAIWTPVPHPWYIRCTRSHFASSRQSRLTRLSIIIDLNTG